MKDVLVGVDAVDDRVDAVAVDRSMI